jgi:hypothetical protein
MKGLHRADITEPVWGHNQKVPEDPDEYEIVVFIL